MGLIKSVGRSGKIVYGSQAVFTFTIRMQTPTISGVSGIEYINGLPNTIGNTFNSFPTAGTVLVAGVTVTLTQADCQADGAGIVKKVIATPIAGWSLGLTEGAPNSITMTSTSIGPVTKPTLALGTATGILLIDSNYIDGKVIPAVGAQDDIRISSKSPITFHVNYTGGSAPDLQLSYGTDAEQANGTLNYESPVTLGGNGSYTLTGPVSFCRLTTKASNTQATLYITC